MLNILLAVSVSKLHVVSEGLRAIMALCVSLGGFGYVLTLALLQL